VPGLIEGSGVAVSRAVPGRLWVHNDSGKPELLALDYRGAVTGRLAFTGASVRDWEAIAVGPCGTASCLYVGDIGDNNARRDQITIYRAPEPDDASGSVAADAFHARYPDGPRNAEALLVGADGRLYVVTKGDTAPIAVYRFPATLQTGNTMTLERVGAPAPNSSRAAARVTGGDVSWDGQWAALRTRSSLTFYKSSDLLAGRWRETRTVDLTALKEPQGEGIALGPNNAVFLVSEGGGKGRAGTFAQFSCEPQG
jgi:hypothetical protein